jgi:hypothetical protein
MLESFPASSSILVQMQHELLLYSFGSLLIAFDNSRRFGHIQKQLEQTVKVLESLVHRVEIQQNVKSRTYQENSDVS